VICHWKIQPLKGGNKLPISKEILRFDKDEILKILRFINQILISLHHIGSSYNDINTETYNRITTEFIDDWKVTQKLSEIRAILSEKFSDELGDDDMDELEREMKDIIYWSINKPKP
jgi:hypothetical protein